MQIASINLRIDSKVDYENSWSNRKNHMIQFIKEKAFDIIGCQEASSLMVQNLKDGLSDLYEIIFQPRDSRGEGTPILYKKGMRVFESGTFWLSETPDYESLVDGSHFPRICTYARFKDFIFFNTHLDYVSDEVCLVQSKYLIKNIQMRTNDNDSVILSGDFNCQLGSKTIQYISKYLIHDYKIKSKKQLTYHGYSDRVLGEPIDYIFHSHDVLTNNLVIHYNKQKDIYLSDHYPISIYITIKKAP